MNTFEEWFSAVLSIRLILGSEVAGKCNLKGPPISNQSMYEASSGPKSSYDRERFIEISLHSPQYPDKMILICKPCFCDGDLRFYLASRLLAASFVSESALTDTFMRQIPKDALISDSAMCSFVQSFGFEGVILILNYKTFILAELRNVSCMVASFISELEGLISQEYRCVARFPSLVASFIDLRITLSQNSLISKNLRIFSHWYFGLEPTTILLVRMLALNILL
ncbi:hypothetical protein SADUNF_Sadunf16G0137300 [Salix dunnii]|uniref:Uncharacterized protein n=1 Tax=Salix dunnii TaxID=1413687 RepID=A0A835JE65_9ROSI|nr:hypothetical protein SADUNF_Sadunf16G0137300 [Salix dunnii]